jgi:PAS domain S-box-containing protein
MELGLVRNPERYLPATLTNRVFALYSITLLLVVGGGLLLFLKYQFHRHVVETEVEAIMLVEVVSQVVQDSVVIGDFDTVQKLLNKAVQGSQFATAKFISSGAGVVHAENRLRNAGQAPELLHRWIANSLPEVNRVVSVGGRDYGVLRLQFDSLDVAAGLWSLSLMALGIGLSSLVGGLVIIRLALGRWLGGLATLSKAVESMGTSEAPEQHLTIADAPLEIQNLVNMVNRTSFLVREREMTRRALQESEERWQLAVRGANDGIWDWDPFAATVHFSDRWKTMLGYGPEEVGDNEQEWFSRVHPEDIKGMRTELQRHLRGETEFYKHEYRLRCKNGRYKWILDRGQALFDEEGRAVRISGSHGDVTERHQAENHLLERTEQLNAIFALSPDGLVSFDRDRRVRSVNPAFLAMTGLDQSELIGRTETEFVACIRELCTPGTWLPEMAAIRDREARRSTGTDSDGQMGMVPRRIELAKPIMRVLEVSQRDAQTETVSQILYFSDVTHKTEVDRMKSEFLSTAAHELRTPMASVLGYSEVLHAQEFERAEQQEFLETILRNVRLMAEIINELLDLARIEARQGKDFKLERLAAEALVQEIVAGFKVPAGREPPRLQEASAAMWLRGDRSKLTQAIGNVLSNAYKYSPDGGPVDIKLIETPASLSSQDGASPQCGICIADAGIGMSPEQLARVCERFYRADASGKIPGTGLGMSIVKEIIELHGGELELASLSGQGSTITLWLPAITNSSTGLVPAQWEH